VIGLRTGAKVGAKVGAAVGLGADQLSSPTSLTRPTYIDAGAVVSGAGALNPAWPAGYVDNDIAILCVASGVAIAVPSTLSSAQGFTAFGTPVKGTFAGLDCILTLFWARASGVQAAPTVAANGAFNYARIMTFGSCVLTGTPVESTVWSSALALDGLAMTVTGGTPGGAQRLAVVVAGAFTGGASTIAGWTNAGLTSVTERIDSSANISGDFMNIGAATGSASTSPYGNTTATWSAAYALWSAASFCLIPRS
jgi:hypothetical protein